MQGDAARLWPYIGLGTLSARVVQDGWKGWDLREGESPSPGVVGEKFSLFATT
jgi:hypothetical protein